MFAWSVGLRGQVRENEIKNEKQVKREIEESDLEIEWKRSLEKLKS